MLDILLNIQIGLIFIIAFFWFNQLLSFKNYYALKAELQEKGNPVYPYETLPFITVQLPMYNEPCTVERLLDACTAFNYPADRYEIQVLDDSTDETKSIVKGKISSLKSKAIPIIHIQRENRDKFRAGALQNGLESAKGELLVIFDADFVPPPDFLLKCIPYFEDDIICAVQPQWGFCNKETSWFTQAQAAFQNMSDVDTLKIDTTNSYMHFKGSGAMWRKEAIQDAGGWGVYSTRIDDWDLGVRAQIKGWEIVPMLNPITLSNLPTDVRGYQVQQYSWVKGIIEVLFRAFRPIWQSSRSWRWKIDCCFNLLKPLPSLFLFLIGLLHLVLFGAQLTYGGIDTSTIYFLYALWLPPSLLFHYITNVHIFNQEVTFSRRLYDALISYLSLWVLLHASSFRNSIGIIEALSGKRTTFIRTPKVTSRSSSCGIDTKMVLELCLAFCFFAAIVVGVIQEETAFLPFHLLYAVSICILFVAGCSRSD